jgi:hypothetical protein
MQVPFFTLANYTNIMNMSYEDAQGEERISFRDLLDVRQWSFVSRFAEVDARQLTAYLSDHTLNEPCTIGSKPCTLAETLVTSKLMSPTLHACEYFFWNQGE